MAYRPEKKKEVMEIDNIFSEMQEIQLTANAKGHFLHPVQAFSPDDKWLVYDTRNDDTHIARTCCVEMVNIDSKDTVQLYSTANQTEIGPGVGAVTFNPKRNQVLFIHGLNNCSPEKPYSFSRRTGVSIKTEFAQKPIFLDARDLTEPYTPGALRGGTHAHTWSPDGEWISFTYNDEVFTRLAQQPNSKVQDLRMVGVMAPVGPVLIDNENSGENIVGEMFSVVVTEVVENPQSGSDQIDRAYGDGWIGSKSHKKPNKSSQKRALAFFGDTRDKNGKKLTEIFVVDIPDDIKKSDSGKPIQGTIKTRPMPPMGTVQRRLTYTGNREYPGVQGPSHPIRSLPDGSMLLFMMRDDNGIVQIYGVSPRGGEIEKFTRNKTSIETTFDVSPDGKYLVYGIGELIHITDITSGLTQKINSGSNSETLGLRAINWSNNSKIIAYNRKVMERDTSYYQVFMLKPIQNEE